MECNATFKPLPNDARYQYSILDRPMLSREPDVRVYVRIKEEETEENAQGADEVTGGETPDDEEIEIKEEIKVEEYENESGERLIIVTEVGTGGGDQNGEPTVYWDTSLNSYNSTRPSEDVDSTTPSSDSLHEHCVCIKFCCKFLMMITCATTNVFVLCNLVPGCIVQQNDISHCIQRPAVHA